LEVGVHGVIVRRCVLQHPCHWAFGVPMCDPARRDLQRD
jgi:hypothetical protein